MKTISAISILVVVHCLFTSPVSTAQGKTAKDDSQRPNIVFLLADDLGIGDVNYNGGRAKTPWLDTMSRSNHSIVLTRHYSGAPVCSPSRGTVLTGRNHNRYCMWSSNTAKGEKEVDFVLPQMMPLPLNEETVAEVLKRGGYRTAMFGKWHLGSLKDIDYENKTWPRVDPGMHGFDEWYATERTVPTAHSNQGCFKTTKARSRCTNYYSRNDTVLIAHPSRIHGDDSAFIADLTVDFINRQASTKTPFFVYVAFHAVHRPTIAVGTYKNHYVKLNYSNSDVHYYGTITAMDAAVGKIRQRLYDLGISNNTLIWFTSDNGPVQGRVGSIHGLLGHKGTLYEGGIRVPGIIEWPAVIKQNRQESYPVVTNDFLPTVADITKIKLQSTNTLDGQSIFPLFQRSLRKRKSPIHWMFRYQPKKRKFYQLVTIHNQYKLIQDVVKDKVVAARLHDLSKYGGEKRDIKLRHEAVLQELQKESRVWKRSVIRDINANSCSIKKTKKTKFNSYRTNTVSVQLP